jgi:hypothetical protein
VVLSALFGHLRFRKYAAPVAAILFFVLCLYGIFPEAAASLSQVRIDFQDTPRKDGLSPAWRIRVNKGTASVGIAREDSESVLSLICRNSSFSIERNIPMSVRDYPFVTWSWKALKLPSSGDVRDKSLNDQALQILAAFDNRTVISYVWDSNAPEGTVVDESIGWPVNLRIKVVVVKSGTADVGKWITHRRNVYQDYRSIFGEEPPLLKGLRIQSNTQYTQDRAEGLVRGITFDSQQSTSK